MASVYTKIFLCSLVLARCATIAYANVDSTDTPLSSVSRFDNNFNIYKWGSDWAYAKFFENNSYVNISETFHSSMLRTSRNQRKWKDDQQMLIDTAWGITPYFAGKLIASSVTFSDRISGINNDIKTNFGSFGFETHYIPNCNITSLIGYKFDERLDQKDRGMTYLVDVFMPYLDWNEYANQVRLYLNGDKFALRENNDLRLGYRVDKTFYEGTADTLSIRWEKKRRDNYDQWDEKNTYVESLNENLFTLENNLAYHINRQAFFELSSEVTSRHTAVDRLKTDDHRAKTDFSSDSNLGIYFVSGRMEHALKVYYQTKTQRNEIPDSLRSSPFSSRFTYVSPDYESSRLAIGTESDIGIGLSDTLTARNNISIFRYDTPEQSNFDDRDELRIESYWQYTHRVSPYLKLRVNAGVNLKHLVFIFGERSADNNWMRIIRLYPELFFHVHENFRIYQAFEVLANYVDYDYEQDFLPASDVRSYVYRKFMSHNVSTFPISQHTSLVVNYKLELEENGKLFWDEWTEMIISTRQNHYVKTYISLHLFREADISAGALFYKRAERFQMGSNSVGSGFGIRDYVSYGPMIGIKYAPHDKLHIIFTASRRAIDQVNRRRYFINNLNLEMSWYL